MGILARRSLAARGQASPPSPPRVDPAAENGALRARVAELEALLATATAPEQPKPKRPV
jgi:hypothetical protein